MQSVKVSDARWNAIFPASCGLAASNHASEVQNRRNELDELWIRQLDRACRGEQPLDKLARLELALQSAET
jgi:acetyl-CoA acetyltransferase